jgi:ParB family chromosome partitioning protein
MTTEKYLPYRGDVKAIVGVGGTLFFTTIHREAQPTGVFRLDADQLNLSVDALPAGGAALVSDGTIVWVAGSDRMVYSLPVKGGKTKPLGAALSEAPTALVLLSDERLGVLTGPAVLVIHRKDGKLLQALELPETGSSLAGDPTGRWLAVGTDKGTIAVFESEDKTEFLPSASDRLHDGAVSALWFEPEELRFLSAGADQKLLSTLARGKLEPEDRGRGNNHGDTVTAILGAPGDRFLTGSRDASVKTWPRGSNVKPSTLKDGVGVVVGLALVTIAERAFLAVACEDNTLRFFQLDEAGKFGDATVRVYDAYAAAKSELGQSEAPRREAALRSLADHNDAVSIELIAGQIKSDADHGLRLLATKLLAAAKHPRAVPLLEPALGHGDEAVRLAAFAGLRKHHGDNDLRPLDLALRAEKADVGKAAVQALESLAPREDQALARLKDALDAKVPEVRQTALGSLEKVFPKDSPDADLAALSSQFADLRRLGLMRLYQRKLLQSTAVQSALRRRTEDADAEVRRVAFLLSLHTREKLLQALRKSDPELERQLKELESGAVPSAKETKKGAKEAHAVETPPIVATPTANTPAGAAMAAMNSQLERLAKTLGIPIERIQAMIQQARSGAGNPADFMKAMTAQMAQLLGQRPGAAPGPNAGEDEAEGEDDE